MTRRQVKELAKGKGFIVRNMKKENIIRMIQRAELNPECFGTDHLQVCNEVECIWRDDCLSHHSTRCVKDNRVKQIIDFSSPQPRV
jgi:hypothetical protein